MKNHCERYLFFRIGKNSDFHTGLRGKYLVSIVKTGQASSQKGYIYSRYLFFGIFNGISEEGKPVDASMTNHMEENGEGSILSPDRPEQTESENMEVRCVPGSCIKM
jgi:hypothetical protein